MTETSVGLIMQQRANYIEVGRKIHKNGPPINVAVAVVWVATVLIDIGNYLYVHFNDWTSFNNGFPSTFTEILQIPVQIESRFPSPPPPSSPNANPLPSQFAQTTRVDILLWFSWIALLVSIVCAAVLARHNVDIKNSCYYGLLLTGLVGSLITTALTLGIMCFNSANDEPFFYLLLSSFALKLCLTIITVRNDTVNVNKHAEGGGMNVLQIHP